MRKKKECESTDAFKQKGHLSQRKKGVTMCKEGLRVRWCGQFTHFAKDAPGVDPEGRGHFNCRYIDRRIGRTLRLSPTPLSLSHLDCPTPACSLGNLSSRAGYSLKGEDAWGVRALHLQEHFRCPIIQGQPWPQLEHRNARGVRHINTLSWTRIRSSNTFYHATDPRTLQSPPADR